MISLSEQVKKLPEKPGIYKFIDSHETYLYIGKAKNIRKRVASYFSSAKSQSGRIKVMLKKISRIDYTVVESEHEALLLENSLIKQIQPKYNVRLKDGKTYPFICIKNEPFPRVLTMRNMLKDGSEYYGPFASGLTKNHLLDMLIKHFYIRTCNYAMKPENISQKKIKLCLRYHINLCKGPCEALQSEKEYLQNIEHIRQILRGKTNDVIRFVEKEMKNASLTLAFEKANELKQTLDALKAYHVKSMVVNPKLSNLDVYSIYSDSSKAVVNYLRIVNGSIIQTDTVMYSKQIDESDADIMTLAIAEIRERFQSNSREIVLPFKLFYAFENTRYVVPRAGDKKKLLDLSQKNAFLYFKELEQKKEQQKSKAQRMTAFLKTVREDMGLKKTPFHIECFDNSNLQGSYPVAAMSVFINGRPDKSLYRHFNIRQVEGPDDYASMEEVIYRRYKRLLDEGGKLPDLIVIDGGKGQISAALKSLEKLNIKEQIELIGIAKKLESIYKAGDKLPLGIDKKSPTNKLIQHLRNEAHRFGITHHRNRRIKGGLDTELNAIKGIGKQSINKLLTVYKSVENIKNAPHEEVIRLIGKDKSRFLFEYFSS